MSETLTLLANAQHACIGPSMSPIFRTSNTPEFFFIRRSILWGGRSPLMMPTDESTACTRGLHANSRYLSLVPDSTACPQPPAMGECPLRRQNENKKQRKKKKEMRTTSSSEIIRVASRSSRVLQRKFRLVDNYHK